MSTYHLRALGGLVASALASAAAPACAATAVVTGNMQSEAGCASDYAPACAQTALTPGNDGVARFDAVLGPADFRYQITVGGTFDLRYGQGGQLLGPEIDLALPTARNVRFYFREPGDQPPMVADNFNDRIVSVPGTFQSEIGCPSDWAPDCLRSWATDPDHDGLHTLRLAIPPGDYEFKFAIDESWDENYGINGTPSGLQFPLTVPANCPRVEFRFVSATNIGSAACVFDLFRNGFE